MKLERIFSAVKYGLIVGTELGLPNVFITQKLDALWIPFLLINAAVGAIKLFQLGSHIGGEGGFNTSEE